MSRVIQTIMTVFLCLNVFTMSTYSQGIRGQTKKNSTTQRYPFPPSPIREPFTVQKTFLGDIPHDTPLVSSPDKKNFAYIVAHYDGLYLYVNGKKTGRGYQTVEDLMLSPQGNHIVMKGKVGLKYGVYEEYVLFDENEHVFRGYSPIGIGVSDGKYKIIYSYDEEYQTKDSNIVKRRKRVMLNQKQEAAYPRDHQIVQARKDNSSQLYTNGTDYFYLVKAPSKNFIVHNGRKLMLPDEVKVGYFGLYFSAGNFCVELNKNEKSFYYCDGESSLAFNKVKRFNFSPDGSQKNFIGISSSSEQLVTGDKLDKVGPKFESIKQKCVYSPSDNSCFYVANKNQKDYLLVDHKVIAKYDEIQRPTFVSKNIELGYYQQPGSSNKNLTHPLLTKVWDVPTKEREWVLAFFARRQNQYYWVIQGKEYLIPYQEKENGKVNITSAPSNPLFLNYLVDSGDTMFLVVNGKANPKFDNHFNPDGSMIAVLRNTKKLTSKQLNNIAIKELKLSINEYIFYVNMSISYSKDHKNYAYVAQENKKPQLVVNGKVIQHPGMMFAPPAAFSPDGKTIGFFAKENEKLYWVVKPVP